MATIGVISDTHGLLRPEALAALAGVDHIIHAGDIGGADIIPRLEEIAPVTAVRGNIDQAGWVDRFPAEAVLEIVSHRVLVLHNRKDLDRDLAAEGIHIVVSGHSHKPNIETVDGILYLNPGSAGPRRFTLPIALGFLELTDGSMAPRIHQISI